MHTIIGTTHTLISVATSFQWTPQEVYHTRGTSRAGAPQSQRRSEHMSIGPASQADFRDFYFQKKFLTLSVPSSMGWLGKYR